MTKLSSLITTLIWAPVLLFAQAPLDTTLYETLDEVLVEERQSTGPLSKVSEGKIRINMLQGDLIPRFAGSADPMRYAQLLPGIQTNTEGSSGIFLRGGGLGHTRMLLNDTPLYSYHHLLGFFSVFNPNHIRGIDIDKNSSVFHARSPEEVADRFSLKGDVGLISSQATLTFPVTGSLSFVLSGRRSYSDWMINLIAPETMDLKYDFHDYDAGMVWEITKKSQLLVNAHYGEDRVGLSALEYLTDGRMNWHNLTASAVLVSHLASHITARQLLYFSGHANRMNLETIGVALEMPSSIQDAGYRSDYTWMWKRSSLSAGLEYSRKDISPQRIASSYNDTRAGMKPQSYISHELVPYLRYSLAMRPDLELDAGFSCSAYALPSERYFASTPEPSLALNYRPSPQHSFSIAYRYDAQYLHMVPVSNVSFATDFWIPADAVTPPMRSHLLSAAYNTSLWQDRLRISTDIYYRYLENVVEYDIPLMHLLHQSANTYLDVYSGLGEAYGLECMAMYAAGTFNAMISYTLSRSVRLFSELNEGKPFPSKQDRRHDLSLSCIWQPDEHWDFGAVFVYASGVPFTAPVDFYMIGGAFLRGHTSYNASRLPDYHRLDLSATYWLRNAKEKKQGINVSVYNCYNQRNPIYVSWPVEIDLESGHYLATKREHRLYSILPSISWIFKF